MTYEWDEIKARLNIAKHGVSFDEAKSVFGDECGLVIFDEDHSKWRKVFAFGRKSKRENFACGALL